MRKKTLIETNPYLRDPERSREALIRSVASSTAVETGEKVDAIARRLAQGRATRPVRKRRAGAR